METIIALLFATGAASVVKGIFKTDTGKDIESLDFDSYRIKNPPRLVVSENANDLTFSGRNTHPSTIHIYTTGKWEIESVEYSDDYAGWIKITPDNSEKTHTDVSIRCMNRFTANQYPDAPNYREATVTIKAIDRQTNDTKRKSFRVKQYLSKTFDYSRFETILSDRPDEDARVI